MHEKGDPSRITYISKGEECPHPFCRQVRRLTVLIELHPSYEAMEGNLTQKGFSESLPGCIPIRHNPNATARLYQGYNEIGLFF